MKINFFTSDMPDPPGLPDDPEIECHSCTNIVGPEPYKDHKGRFFCEDCRPHECQDCGAECSEEDDGICPDCRETLEADD
jgi:hypothetical protein